MTCLLLALFFLGSIGITPLASTAQGTTDITGTITNADVSVSAPWITSDKADYPPGALATLTGGGWMGDSEVKIVVEGSSSDSQAWTLEKIVPAASDGSIELQFNLPGWYVPQYKVTATGLTTGRTAATTFTDTGGAYSLNFWTYDPKYYDFKLPSYYTTVPSGRASNPMPGADGTHKLFDTLAPSQLALGQIVPFEVAITVNGDTTSEDGTIKFTCLWGTETSSNDTFGYDPHYGVYAAFVDYGDVRNDDHVKPASASILSSEEVSSQIKGTIQVSGLDNGDTIIVEIWVVLDSKLPDGNVGGTVQVALDSAVTAAGDTINGGNRTVPLNKLGEFETAKAKVNIVKTDTPDPLYAGDSLTYSITVTNNSADVVANGITVTDTLDPYVTVTDAGGGTQSVDQITNITRITWTPFALEPGVSKIITVTVNVNPNAPTDIYGGTAAQDGASTEIIIADICNKVQFDMITDYADGSNNAYWQPTNVLPKAVFTAYKVWVGGPAADHQPVTLILYRKVEGGTNEVVTGVEPAITPATGTANEFTYTWTGLPKYNAGFQEYTYSVEESAVPTNYNETKSEDGLTITNTYKPSLTILKVYGTGPLEGAIFELYKGTVDGKDGASLESVTTGTDGKAVFEHLGDGIYWLAEAKPPLGYKSINDIGPITVANGAITGPAGFTTAPDGISGNYIITVQDEPVGTLPATGGIGTIPFAAGGLGLMIFAILYEKKKED